MHPVSKKKIITMDSEYLIFFIIQIPISNAIKWHNLYFPVVCITEKNMHAYFLQIHLV